MRATPAARRRRPRGHGHRADLPATPPRHQAAALEGSEPVARGRRLTHRHGRLVRGPSSRDGPTPLPSGRVAGARPAGRRVAGAASGRRSHRRRSHTGCGEATPRARRASADRTAPPLPAPPIRRAGTARRPTAATGAAAPAAPRRRRRTAAAATAPDRCPTAPTSRSVGLRSRPLAPVSRARFPPSRAGRRRALEPMAGRLEMGDRSRLDGRHQPEQGERRQDGDRASRAIPVTTAAKPPPLPLAGRPQPAGDRTGRQRQHRRHDELRQHERHEGVGQSPAPVRHRRPHEGGQRQGEEEHRHRDRGGAHHQLQPQDERGHGHDETAEEDDEAGIGDRSTAADGSEELEEPGEQVRRVDAGARQHRGGHGVGDGQGHADERHGHTGEQQGTGAGARGRCAGASTRSGGRWPGWRRNTPWAAPRPPPGSPSPLRGP